MANIQVRYVTIKVKLSPGNQSIYHRSQVTFAPSLYTIVLGI